jgi:hypothetical protein
MARSVQMLPMARASGTPAEISITDGDWKEIEVAYGHALPSNVRQSIVEATNKFLYWEIFERNAKPAKDAVDLISSIRVKSGELRSLLARGGDVGFVAQQLVAEQFNKPRRFTLARHERLFHALDDVLMPLSAACKQALITVADQENLRPFREGRSWNDWIRRLTTIIRENKLSSQVSKGSDKSQNVSPFTKLVAALQKQLPEEAQRHCQGPDGLATAIVRACKKPSVKSEEDTRAMRRVRNSATSVK